MTLKAAAIQMNSVDDVAANLREAERLLGEAASAGAALAVLPENFAFMGARDTAKLAHAEAEGSGPIQQLLSDSAKRLSMWIVGGTLPMAVPGRRDKVCAASLVYDAQGQCVARYDKVHLFDVDVARDGANERYRESGSIEAGAPRIVVEPTPVGRLGLSVCYDLRFPELYRALTAQSAEILCVPSAFTEKTGAAHWEILLRARAVENLCFVIAPGQCGTHPGGRRTWGHSMIVGPWGEILAQRVAGEGVVIAQLDLEKQAAIRSSFPVLTHRRMD
ncbi:MAG: carbon-nitrogen hydrolase family protein [Rhodanobacteraceae bacterium]